MSETFTLEERQYLAMSAIASYFKALYFCGSAMEVKDINIILSAFSIYDTLLHLGIGMCLWDTENLQALRLTKELVRDLDGTIKALKQKEKLDPASTLSHRGVQDYLSERKKDFAFLDPVCIAFCELRDIRNFAHYAPRVLRDGAHYLFHTCQYTAAELRERVNYHISKSEVYFEAYYRLVETVKPGNWVFLHFAPYEDLYLYSPSSNGLPSYYPMPVQEMAKRIHAKFRNFGEETWKCKCT